MNFTVFFMLGMLLTALISAFVLTRAILFGSLTIFLLCMIAVAYFIAEVAVGLPALYIRFF